MKQLFRPALILLSSLWIGEQPAFAQHPLNHSCSTDEMTVRLCAANPGLQQHAEDANRRFLKNASGNRSTTPPTYIIPVVFHVIHNYGTENISDAQILDAVVMLNEDFRKLNADTSQIVSPFDTIAADCEIEFRLARLDPNGNCTNGIDRIASLETNVGDDGSKLNQWPRDKYLNIWVVKQISIGASGYAYTPSYVDLPFQAPNDGVMILSNYVGRIGTSNSVNARVLTHMAGHSLGLSHLGFNCTNGDGIADTPITGGWFTCQLTNNDLCNPGTPENVQNFMEYNSCLRMFTRGQRDLMHAVLNSAISDRNNLWTTANLNLTGVNNPVVTCAPHADFKVNRKMVGEGGTITFTDLSWSSNASAWQWTLFGPDTITTPSFQNPVLTMNTPGSYHVRLIASNSAGSDTITKLNFITVGSNSATFNSTYVESFEVPNVFYVGYVANDGYGNGSAFSQTTSVGHTGTGSVIRPFGNSQEGDVDDLITPSYYLTYNTNLQLSFVYAYAPADTSPTLNTPSLKVWSSVNCGQSWTQRWVRTGSAVQTSGINTGNFIPTGPNDWDTVVVTLNALASPNVRFKFEFTAPYDNAGNNLYIDDINILSTNVGIADTTSSSFFTIYPNPSDGNSMISYSLHEPSEILIELYDMSGRLVQNIYSGEQQTGNYSIPISTSTNQLTEGTYLIRMMVEDDVTSRRLVVVQNVQ